MIGLRTVAICAPPILAIALLGCSSSKTEPIVSSHGTEVVPAVNADCPIMGKPVKANGGRTAWNEQTIGFCCPKCIDQWEALSEEEKTFHLANAGNDHSGDHDQGDHQGH